MYHFYPYSQTNCFSSKIWQRFPQKPWAGRSPRVPLKVFPTEVCLQRFSEFRHSKAAAYSFEVLQEALLLCGLRTLLLFVFFWLVQKKKITRWYQETKIIYSAASTRGCSCILLNPEPTTVNKRIAATAARLPTEMTNETIIDKKTSNVVKDEENYIETHWIY